MLKVSSSSLIIYYNIGFPVKTLRFRTTLFVSLGEMLNRKKMREDQWG